MSFSYSKLFSILGIIMLTSILIVGCGGGGGNNNVTSVPPTGIKGYVYQDNSASTTEKTNMIISGNKINKSLLGISNVKVYVQGKIANTDQDGYFKVTGLTPGNETVSFVHSNYLSISCGVNIEKEKIIQVQSASFPRIFQLVIGVSDYSNYPGSADDLSGCDDDARAISQSIHGSLDVAYNEVLIDSSATVENIKNKIEQIGTLMQPDDHFVFYFSGHGRQVILQDIETCDEFTGTTLLYDEVICAYDDDIRDDDLEEWVANNINSENVLFIFDSCYSEGMYKGISEPVITPKDLYGYGYTVISACREDEFSTGYVGDLSLFTKYFIDGLNDGRADSNNNREITATEIFNYLEPKVVNEKSTQHPVLNSEGYDPIIYKY